MNNIYVDMVGDLFHINHINLIKEAKKFGKCLIVGVHSDEDVESYKCTPILTMDERIGVIESCKYVNKVIPNAPLVITKEYLDEYNIDLVVHAHNEDEIEKYNFMYNNIIKLGKFKRIDYHDGISTTNIKHRVIKEYLTNQLKIL
jgi:cytidyltransferase-like protein